MGILVRAAKLLSRVLPQHVAVVERGFPDVPLAPDARIAVDVAQSDALASLQVHPLPERLLLAVLEGDAVVAGLPEAHLATVRDDLLVALARPDLVKEARSVPLPSRTAAVLARAASQARRWGRPGATVGDLVAAIAAADGDAARAARMLALDPSAIDRRRAPDLAPAAEPSDAHLSIWTLDDAVSRMDDVAHVIRAGFEVTQRRALHVMMTTHGSGHARVGTYPRRDAEEKLARAKKHAAARSCPLRFHVGRG